MNVRRETVKTDSAERLRRERTFHANHLFFLLLGKKKSLYTVQQGVACCWVLSKRSRRRRPGQRHFREDRYRRSSPPPPECSDQETRSETRCWAGGPCPMGRRATQSKARADFRPVPHLPPLALVRMAGSGHGGAGQESRGAPPGCVLTTPDSASLLIGRLCAPPIRSFPPPSAFWIPDSLPTGMEKKQVGTLMWSGAAWRAS